jgi:hypothetical protein
MHPSDVEIAGAKVDHLSAAALADQMLRDATESRQRSLKSAHEQTASLEQRLTQLDHEREQAIQAWSLAEENLRAELQGMHHFIEQASEIPSERDRPVPLAR